MKATRKYRRGLAAALTTVLAVSLAACGGEGGGADGGGNEVEVFTWWAEGSEKAGLDALVAVFDQQHPEIEFVGGLMAGSVKG